MRVNPHLFCTNLCTNAWWVCMRYFCRIRELRVNSLPPRIKIYFIYFSSIFCKDYISCAISDSIWDIFRPFGHFWVSEGKTSKNIYHFNVLNLFLQAQKWWIISLFSILWLIFGHFINPFLNYFFFFTFFGHYWVFQHPNNVKSTIFLTFISNSLSRESGK